jgi:integrase
MIKLSLVLGTRRGELWALRHADVRRQAMSLHVEGTKTKAAVRDLPINSGTLAVIDSLPRSLTDDRIFWMVESPGLLTYAWRRTAYHAGLDICMHVARHECLSRLAESADADLLKLRAYSGHTTLVTLGRYARPTAESLRSLIA